MVHDSQDFLALVPYLLGYHPDEQLVFLVVGAGRLVVSGAMPLSMFTEPTAAREALLGAVDQVDRAQVLLACWSLDKQRADEALARAEIWLGAERVLDSLHVGPTRWCSRGHHERSGSTGGLVASAAAAEAVYAGLVAAPGRDDVVRRVDGPDPEDPRPGEALLAAQQELVELPIDRWPATAVGLQAAGREERLDEARLARLAVLSADALTRQDLWLAMSRRTAPGDLDTWVQVVGRASEPWAVAPLLCLGLASWLAGQGTLLVACLERLSDLDPGHPSVGLLDRVNRQALPPSAWDRVRAQWYLGRNGATDRP